MDDKCKFCGLDADYMIQWGPQSNQKVVVCSFHVTKQLSRIKANEMYIVKVNKLDED